MISIVDNYNKIKQQLPTHVSLAAVSKFHPASAILELYENCGHRIFAESRVQELLEKQQTLPKDIQWHFIGHLQTNKVKAIVPFVSLIQSVDSMRLLEEINKQAASIDRPIEILIQIHIAQEEHKYGFLPDEALDIVGKANNMSHIKVRGLMGMATFTDDEGQIEQEFILLRSLFDNIVEQSTIANFDICSFGMSDDFELAIEKGSNMVRVGSAIFGNRNY